MGTIKVPELKQYIFRKLGHPVINVEVDEIQLEDCIDEALKTFMESHYDSVVIGYHPLDVLQGVSDYTLPESVQDVMECLNIEGRGGPGLQSIDPGDPFLWEGLSGTRYGGDTCDVWDVTSVEVARQRWALWEDTWKIHILYEFNQISKIISFPDAPDQSGIRMLKVYQAAVDTAETNTVLDALWFKKYAVALARIQWGVNVGKYEGAQLPGGVSINHAAISEKGEADKEKLLLELEEKYSLPPDPVFA